MTFFEERWTESFFYYQPQDILEEIEDYEVQVTQQDLDFLFNQVKFGVETNAVAALVLISILVEADYIHSGHIYNHLATALNRLSAEVRLTAVEIINQFGSKNYRQMLETASRFEKHAAVAQEIQAGLANLNSKAQNAI